MPRVRKVSEAEAHTWGKAEVFTHRTLISATDGDMEGLSRTPRGWRLMMTIDGKPIPIEFTRTEHGSIEGALRQAVKVRTAYRHYQRKHNV